MLAPHEILSLSALAISVFVLAGCPDKKPDPESPCGDGTEREAGGVRAGSAAAPAKGGGW